MGRGTPKRAGNKSLKSTYSLCQILFASFLGIGGECGPIDIAKPASSLDGFERNNDSGDCRDSTGLALELVVIVLAVPEDAFEAMVDNAVVAPAVDDPKKVTMPDNAAAFGMLPKGCCNCCA